MNFSVKMGLALVFEAFSYTCVNNTSADEPIRMLTPG